MNFFDCNVSYGRNYEIDELRSVLTISELLGEMKNAGVKKAMVYRREQLGDAGPEAGNMMLSKDIKGLENLYGIWSIVPSHTHEIPDPDCMIEEMRRNRVFAWRLNPSNLRFLPKVFVLKDWLQLAQDRNIPVYMNKSHGISLESIGDMLEKFTELTVILSESTIWPNDRLLRPFVKEFPNVYLDLSMNITAGGIESFVNEFGPYRLLFGSGFPDSYFGGNMLAIKYADIPIEAQEAIAGGNIERIIRSVRL